MPLALAHITGTAHLHGDLYLAVLAILVVMAIGLASSLWKPSR